MTKLTPEALRKAEFRMTMHLNRGQEHDQVLENEALGLVINSTSRKPTWRVTQRLLRAPKITGAELDLLDRDRFDERVQEFCDAYNAGREKA